MSLYGNTFEHEGHTGVWAEVSLSKDPGLLHDHNWINIIFLNLITEIIRIQIQTMTNQVLSLLVQQLNDRRSFKVIICLLFLDDCLPVALHLLHNDLLFFW